MSDLRDIFEKTKTDWDKLLKDERNSNLRIRDAAFKLNLSEAELLSTNLGDLVKFLRVDNKSDFLNRILMFLSRNDYVVHEKILSCKDVELQQGGLIKFKNTNIDIIKFDIDSIKYIFSEKKVDNNKELRSIQFFNRQGSAIFKIYLKSDQVKEYDLLISEFQVDYDYVLQSSLHFNNHEMIDKKSNLVNETFDSFKYENLIEWKCSRINKTGIFRNILEISSKEQYELGIYVVGLNCNQFHFGLLDKVVDYRGWLNILDPEFNIHVKEDFIESKVSLFYDKKNVDHYNIQFSDALGRCLVGILPSPGYEDVIWDIVK
tara:strand:- start:218 stop:1171 length:954 start_codon:yes stop_codon:yes gene_type:complete